MACMFYLARCISIKYDVCLNMMFIQLAK